MDSRKRLRKVLPEVNSEGLGLSLETYAQEEDTEDNEGFNSKVSEKKKRGTIKARGNPLGELPQEEQEAPELLETEQGQLELPMTQRTPKPLDSVLEKCRRDNKGELEVALAKGVLKDQRASEHLIVSAPSDVKGFISRTVRLDARSQLRAQLQGTANQRKTRHLTESLIFEKSQSELSESAAKTMITEGVGLQEDWHRAGFKAFSENSTLAGTSPTFRTQKKSEFIDDLGSDHEGSDHIIKRGTGSEEEGTEGELGGLTDIDLNPGTVHKKYMSDTIAQDHLELYKVVNAEFKRSREQRIDLESFSSLKKVKMREEERKYAPSPRKSDQEERELCEKAETARQSIELRAFRNQPQRTLMIDEGSISYLNMLEKTQMIKKSPHPAKPPTSPFLKK